jgi:hypothetical protein
MGRVVLVFGVLLSMCGIATVVAGEYQRTKDEKTLVWSVDSKPKGSASWWGARDKEGYAKGIGELTWYTAQGNVFARYYGNMVHGKFDGPVNVHVKGTTAHAFFSDGKRMTGWARGPASSRFATDWRSALAREKAEAAPATSPLPSTAPASASEELRNKQQTQESPAEGPTAEGRRKEEELGKAKFAPANLPARGEERTSEQKESTENRTSTPPSQSSGAAAVQRPTNQPTESQSQRTENKEQQAVNAAGQASESPPSSVVPHASPSAPHPSPVATQDHGSLAELAAPPASLRNEPTVETPATSSEADLASSPSASAQLTTDEAVTIADSEARARGYDLSQYERPKADYSKVKGKWSFVYDLKNPGMAEESARRFRVTVDDTSRKADVNP